LVLEEAFLAYLERNYRNLQRTSKREKSKGNWS